MSATIETVAIDDVYPLEDEYGNSMARRDYSLKANRDYVKKLAESFGPSKLPDEMPVLVRDGGIYRIKSGNSRIEAMRLLGVKKFPAVVDGDLDPKDVVECVWRTDTKKTYESAEKAEVFKALTLFGADEYVAEVTGYDKEKVSRLRVGARKSAEAVAQYDLEWMEAIGEFEGHPRCQELADASPKEWRGIYDQMVRERKIEEKKAAFRELLAESGIEESESVPADFAYAGRCDNPKKFDPPEGAVAVMSSWGELSWYAPKPEADPEEEERKRVADLCKGLYEKARAAREEWLAENVLDVHKMGPLLMLPGNSETPWCYAVDNMLGHLVDFDDVPEGPADVVNSYLGSVGGVVREYGDREFLPEMCAKFCRLTDALKACGYEPPEEEERLYDMAKEHAEGEK